MVEHAKPEDLDRLLELYAGARDYMSRSGNPTQWGADYPARAILEQDLGRGELYVIRRNKILCGAFVLALGEDPTYARIEGAWLRQGPYGTIHRLTGAEGDFCRVPGVLPSQLPGPEGRHPSGQPQNAAAAGT